MSSIALILITHTLRPVALVVILESTTCDEHNATYIYIHIYARTRSVCLSVFLSPPSRQRIQSDVAVFGTANVDSEYICLAMEERVACRRSGARNGSNIVPFH